MIPAVSKLKWLEPRHLVNVEGSLGARALGRLPLHLLQRPGLRELEMSGIWNQFTPRRCRDAAAHSSVGHQSASATMLHDWEHAPQRLGIARRELVPDAPDVFPAHVAQAVKKM